MDSYESTRRSFIKKLGLSVGAATLGKVATSAEIVEKNIQFPLSSDQKEFMDMYEDWMDEFVEVIHQRKVNPDDLEANKKLMQLSEQSEAWQKKLSSFMEDENFARHYMIVTERMTNTID